MARNVLLSLVDGDRPVGGEVRVLTAMDGIEIRAARWEVDAGTAAKGTVLLFHGYSEFIEKYYEVIGELRERGYSVATFDWRGQGLSERLIEDSHKGYVSSFSDFVSDAIMVLNQVVVQDMPPPYLLMAHSMGGNVALRLLVETSGRFERCVLSAPMVGWDLGPPLAETCLAADQAVAAGLGDMYAPGATEIDLDSPLNRVTSDLDRFERWMAFYRHEPRLVMAGVTARWIREGAYSTALVMDPERAARITVPTADGERGEGHRGVSAASEGAVRDVGGDHAPGDSGIDARDADGDGRDPRLLLGAFRPVHGLVPRRVPDGTHYSSSR